MRRYDRQHGNLPGVDEDPELCIVETLGRLPYHTKQCPDKRGHGENGLFCERHAEMIENDEYVWIPKDEE